MLKLVQTRILCPHPINYGDALGWNFGLDALQLLLEVQIAAEIKSVKVK